MKNLRGESSRLNCTKKVVPGLYHEEQHSVSDLLSEQIIVRAPDRMLQLVDGFLVLAWLNDLIIIDCEKEGILQDELGFKNFKHIDLDFDKQLQFLTMHHKYKIITIQDIGSDPKKTQVCVVVEELKNRLVRYLKFDFDGDENGENK